MLFSHRRVHDTEAQQENSVTWILERSFRKEGNSAGPDRKYPCEPRLSRTAWSHLGSDLLENLNATFCQLRIFSMNLIPCQVLDTLCLKGYIFYFLFKSKHPLSSAVLVTRFPFFFLPFLFSVFFFLPCSRISVTWFHQVTISLQCWAAASAAGEL